MEAETHSRLGPDAWVDVAYRAFEDGGVDAVRVDRLTKSLGVTRGSFYWHFKDRAALLHAVLERWDASQTEGTIEANERAGGAAAERLLRLLRTCASDDGRFEMGVRAWAQQDRGARAVVARIDRRRIAYMTNLAVGAGVEEQLAEARARVAYLAWLGSYMDAVPSPDEQRLADMDALWHMMLGQ